MFTVPAEGGVAEKLPFPSGYQASMSPDGQSIAYEPIGKAFRGVEVNGVVRHQTAANGDRGV